ncbi:MAG: ABC transporter permease subunit [Verrucomicrobia bacterium]|nr:ABC transporter permease subunit [Verrucomicrobiota bacterium]
MFRSFSPARIWTLASATVTQLVRMKIMAFLLVFCVIVVAAGFAFPVMNPEQQLKLLKDVSFGALQVFSVVIAIVSTALLLPRDLEDRTLYTILSKPVPRYEYLIGKLLGVLVLIGAGLILMDIAFSAVLWLRQNIVFAQALAALKQEGTATPETIAQLQEFVGRQGLTWNIHLGVLAIFLKASVIAALSLMISCFASSTLFTVVIALLTTIIGHGQGLIREYFLSEGMNQMMKKAGSALLAVITPDLGVFDVVDTIINGELVSAFSVGVMVGTAAMYVTGYAVVSHLLFVEKEL